MKVPIVICPLMSDSVDKVNCAKTECAFFNRDFDICALQVITNQLTEINSN